MLLILALLLQDVEGLIRRLGADSFAERQQAIEELVRTGRKAVPALEEAVRSGDPETALRAREALDRILGRRLLQWRLEDRATALARGGGSPETEAAVRSALRWLARHQEADGGWTSERGCAGCPKTKEATPDVDRGLTGLALLAFLGAGCTPQDREFGDVVRRGLARMAEGQEPEGCLGPRGEKYLYGHAIGALALAEAYALTEEEARRAPAQKAADFTVGAQNPGKGWRYSFRSGDNDTSVTFWATLSLLVAEEAGLRVPKEVFRGPRAWLAEVTEEAYYRVGYLHRGGRGVRFPEQEQFDPHESMTGAGVFLRSLLGEARTALPVKGGADLLIRDKPSPAAAAVDYYYWHTGTLALYRQDGPDGKTWTSWNDALKAAVLKLQAAEGCRAGSWDPEDRWSPGAGRVYATALNALTLETYYRYRVNSGAARSR